MSTLLPITIDRLRESNTAGGCKLQLVRVEHVATWPEEVNGTLADGITLVADASWITIMPTLWTHAFGETWEMVDGSQRSVARLGAVIPKDRAALLAGLFGLKPGRYVVLHHDRNGNVKVIGTPTEPAQVRVQELTHGADPRGDRNQYLLSVVCARLTPAPFYGADPPLAGVPADCPSLAEQISATTWAVIEALLSSGQLDDAEASLCGTPPSLCDLVDDAIVLPSPGSGGGALLIEDAGEATVNGVYLYTGDVNGKPAFSNAGGITIEWDGAAWIITDGTDRYDSTEDVPTPWDVVTWNASGWTGAPTVTELVSGNLMLVAGAGSAWANGYYLESGTNSGRPQYLRGTVGYLQWTGSNWMVHDGAEYYVGVEDVATPDLVTTWNALTADAPAPTVDTAEIPAGGGGTPGDASALTDCFSPEQEEVVLEELGVVSFSGIDDAGPSYSNSLVDPDP